MEAPAAAPAAEPEATSVAGRVASELASVAGRIGASPSDRPETRDRKRLLVGVVLLVLPASVLWGAIYWAAGERTAAVAAGSAVDPA